MAAVEARDPIPGHGNSGFATEGNSIFFIVTAEGDVNTTRYVNYTTTDGVGFYDPARVATAGSDYIAQNGTLEFAPGEIRAHLQRGLSL